MDSSVPNFVQPSEGVYYDNRRWWAKYTRVPDDAPDQTETFYLDKRYHRIGKFCINDP